MERANGSITDVIFEQYFPALLSNDYYRKLFDLMLPKLNGKYWPLDDYYYDLLPLITENITQEQYLTNIRNQFNSGTITKEFMIKI